MTRRSIFKGLAMRSIYLDYNTTTPVATSVRESMLPFLTEFYGQPSSSHWLGRAAQEALEDARAHVAVLLGCHPAEIVFTSGGTESVNLALLGVAHSISQTEPELTPHLITTPLEHACARRCAEQLERQGWQISVVGCDSQGVVQVEQLKSLLRENTRLVSIVHANQEIGTIQPLSYIADICHEHNILLHSDAAQTVGKIACSVEALGVDLLSFSGHKFYAPKGIGGLYIKLGVPIVPILCGEGNEGGLRPGTENVPHIVALGSAARLAMQGMDSAGDRLAKLRDRFHSQLEQLLKIAIPVHGDKAERIPNALSFELPGANAFQLQQRIPEICFGPLSAMGGTKCNGFPNPTYSAIGLTLERIAETYRISLGWPTSEQEIDQACQVIAAAYESILR